MKIEFYILEETHRQQGLHFACRLVEKTYSAKRSIYIQTESQEEAENLDNLLWTFKDDSFLPHQISHSSTEFQAPIQIGYASPADSQQGILFNLSREFPTFYKQFGEVIEIVFSDPVVQQLARERFRQYRQLGCEIVTHKMKASEVKT